MDEKRFKYRFDRRSRRITIGLLSAVIVLVLCAWLIWGGTYLSAWGVFFVLCIVTLYILSIPRFVLINDSVLEVHCIVDLTRIHVEDIEVVRPIDRREFKRLWPLVGSYGFWGYYGYYFSFWEWSVYKVYASDRQHLILVEDIYEDTYIISCSQSDELIAAITEARDRKRAEIVAAHAAASSGDRQE